MSDRPREALYGDHYPSTDEDAAIIVAAARRLLEAEEVWWCEEHEVSGWSSAQCWQGGFDPDDFRDCRVVPAKLLVDPQEGESE